MKKTDSAMFHVMGFVAKSGGLEKVEATVPALRGVIERGQETQYLARLAKQPGGARQLLVCAMTGCILASALTRGAIASSKKEHGS